MNLNFISFNITHHAVKALIIEKVFILFSENESSLYILTFEDLNNETRTNYSSPLTLNILINSDGVCSKS